MTLVLNLFGGPGSGKSTTAAAVFAQLKQDGVNCEVASEFAKDLTWEERVKALNFQPYVIAKQVWRISRLIGQVDVVITDSPILLAIIYGNGVGYPLYEFNLYIVEQFRKWRTLNFFLERGDYEYSPVGRNQTLEEASMIDGMIQFMLRDIDVKFATEQGGGVGAPYICQSIHRRLAQDV